MSELSIHGQNNIAQNPSKSSASAEGDGKAFGKALNEVFNAFDTDADAVNENGGLPSAEQLESIRLLIVQEFSRKLALDRGQAVAASQSSVSGAKSVIDSLGAG